MDSKHQEKNIIIPSTGFSSQWKGRHVKFVDEPVVEPVDEPVVEPDDEPVDEPDDEPVDEPVLYGVIFITAEPQVWDNGIIYDYNDKIYINAHDEKDVILLWSGQKKHGKDYIVTDGDRQIHVCSRKKSKTPYIYRGVIQNDTKSQIIFGDKSKSIPDQWKFAISTSDTPVPCGTELVGKTTKHQIEAVNAIGFKFKSSSCGIYKMWK